MNRLTLGCRPLRIIAAGLLLLGLSGCEKVTKENYDKLKAGMSYDEVVQLLGEPARCELLMGAKNCNWGQSPKSISVQMIADKVVLFESEGL